MTSTERPNRRATKTADDNAETPTCRISTLDQLSTSMLHDLRNPLSTICGCAEMLLDLDLTPEQVERVSGNIHQAAGRMRELLDGLFDLTQGKIAAPETCGIRELIIKACTDCAAAAHSQGVEVSLDLRVGGEIRAVRSRMEQVFMNLMTNALEAMPLGGAICIAARETADHTVITVEDSGPGIPTEIQNRLFEPFVSAHKENGLGLGLAISRRTIRDYGGEMWAESARGARFVIRLPLTEAVPASCLAPQTAAAEE